MSGGRHVVRHKLSVGQRGQNPVINPEPQPAPTFISDTNADLGVNGAYTFKITSKNGKAPSFTVSPSGVFDVKLVKSAGDDYFFKITAIGAPGTRASVYVNGIRLLTATIKSNPSYVKSDTTHPFRVKAGKSYVFKLTANAKPYFVAGTGTAFRVSFVRQSGKDYFFRVTAIGKVGTASGFYINHQKAPVAIATIGS